MAHLFQINLALLRLIGRVASLLIVCALIPQLALAADGPKPPRAKLKISGYGLVHNWELKRMLRTLELSGKKPEFFDAGFIEDSALLLSARVKRDGYLAADVFIELKLANGGAIRVQASDLIENPLPRPLQVTEAKFVIHKGVLFHYKNLRFQGLETVRDKDARSYFVETAALLPLKSGRVYTPEKLRRGLSSLTDVLERRGYEQAQAEATELVRDDKSGAVNVLITVHQGPKSVVRSVHEEFFYPDEKEPREVKTVFPNKSFSKVWLQDFVQGLKTNQFHRGYPDTTVEVNTVKREPEEKLIRLDLSAKIQTGPQIRIGGVKFTGQKRTRVSLMERRVRVQRGELLDRTRTEQGRYRLAQLGAFAAVDLDYAPLDEHTREVVYHVREGRRMDVNLLAGYGSYELLRGGVELEEFNIWGLAHHARLKAVQSFKASSGEFVYTIPEFVGNDVDLFFNATALRREEVSFTREEYGGGFGGHKVFKPISTDLSVRYNYQILNAAGVPGLVATEGLTNAAVGAIITDLKHDRRDNPLYPRSGYKVFMTFELASEYLGGDVDYERVEVSTSWHHKLGGGRVISIGFSHGVVVTQGDPAKDLPFNKRFFPGGENSIRGYSEDEASPRNEEGKIVGAETFSLGTVEFEQALTPAWSLVFFSDSLGEARSVQNYPFDTGLFSVGGGLRWKTIIGPVRLEYGHNLNPRKGDPNGTFHFSLGFPF